MRWYERMRYYQPFPAAIPLWKAGYPRVTHPSATKLKSSVRKHRLIVPFDLHVLGTPPAFILSQDQTLMLKFFVPLRKRFDLNMKEILQVKMDLAFHFYPFTELGCSKNWCWSFDRSNLIRQFNVLWISSSWSARIMFLPLWARSLKM